MLRLSLLTLIIASSFISCSSEQNAVKNTISTNSITKVEMNLSAYGVESDDFPSIAAYIDFVNDSSNCEKTYYNPALKPSMYKLSSAEIKRVFVLLTNTDLNKLKKEYKVSKTDRPTSTITICIGQRTILIKDYGLEGDYPLKELYKIVYKY